MIVAGYGTHARGVVRGLRAANVAHVVATLSPHGAAEAATEGSSTVLGDYTRRPILESTGVDAARMFVVADDDTETAARAVSLARLMGDDMHVVAVANTDHDAEELRAAGADDVVVVHGSVQSALLDRIFASMRTGGVAAASTRTGTAEEAVMRTTCTHLDQIRTVTPRTPGVCEDCVRTGSRWLHLRTCMTCGHVGCCDSSPNRHARQHFREANHPIVQSAEPGEEWGWCFIDDIQVTIAPVTP